jgi:hypothetical protein
VSLPLAGAGPGSDVVFAAPAALACDAANFDGTNDWLGRSSDPTGAADGKTGIVSYWFRINGGDGVLREVMQLGTAGGSNVRIEVKFTSGNTHQFIFKNSAGTIRWQTSSLTAYLAGDGWHHCLAAWDMSDANKCKIYVDDVDITNSTTGPTDDTLDYTTNAYGIGAINGGASKFTGDLAEFFWAPNQWIDVSIANNRRLFRTSGGKPADMGSDGSGPTGTKPLIYLHLDDAETANNFATNRTVNGDFTVTGALTTASSSPSD